MFKDFLNNPETYKHLEQDLERTFVSLLEKEHLDKKNLKIPYYKTHFANGKAIMDGNPIFSAKNLVTGDTLRVVMDENADETAFLDRNADNSQGFCIFGSTDNLRRIHEKMSEWIKKQK